MERSAVDLKIERELCANGIPFNVLRNPQFQEMVTAIKRAPNDYKAPSSEKARTVLLDECVGDVEKELIPFKDTWYSHGLSIVSDGWINVKYKPLINVLAVNNRGSMFMYAEDFSEILQKEFFWLEDTYNKGKTIVKYFMNHGQALSMFRENSKLELLQVAKTRFASHYILLKRLTLYREALSTTISLNSWRDWAKQGDEQARNAAQTVVNIIRDDNFWNEVENILKITKPIYMVVKFCDGEGLKMGEIYEKMDIMLGEIKYAMELYFSQVKQILLNRWEKMSIPLHCLGFALSPRFYDTRFLETIEPGGEKRTAPNNDKQVVNGVLEAFNRIGENEAERNLLRAPFATFHMKKGLYSLLAAHLDVVTMEAIDGWSTYGAKTPELAEVAKKVLSQPISSSSAERNWSTYSNIHSVKRNRLNCKTADKLVYAHSNIRMISRFSESYKEGPHKK
ncbi:uncharacterized protein LOC143575638 [Bidens hawaiensis]|uniref:uncharacterized protein LOC143575638 n=1 Tax=Bidens hawaiensis TaxID=980011 RepID=UPI00404A95C7